MRKSISFVVLCAFVLTCVMPPNGFAQSVSALGLMPEPGARVALSEVYKPAQFKAMTMDPNDPFKFNFVIDRGDAKFTPEEKQLQYAKLVKYFLAALAVPDTDQWVNLSPYEQDRIIPDNFGLTEMGRDLLAQDYLLKQIASSLSNPDTDLGRKFWDGVYAKAYEKFGSTSIPADAFNKVWVVPSKAVIYENGNMVYVVSSDLKVMLDTDYLAMKNNGADDVSSQQNATAQISQDMMRELIIPAIEKEVNEGKSFAPLRQVYSGMLLATWYKRALKGSILDKLYADKGKVKGIDQDPAMNQEIYTKYVEAFKKGVFNMIKEDTDRYTNEVIPRKYFSGGEVSYAIGEQLGLTTIETVDQPVAQVSAAVVIDQLDNVDIQLTDTGAGFDIDAAERDVKIKATDLSSDEMRDFLNTSLNAYAASGWYRSFNDSPNDQIILEAGPWQVQKLASNNELPYRLIQVFNVSFDQNRSIVLRVSPKVAESLGIQVNIQSVWNRIHGLVRDAWRLESLGKAGFVDLDQSDGIYSGFLPYTIAQGERRIYVAHELEKDALLARVQDLIYQRLDGVPLEKIMVEVGERDREMDWMYPVTFTIIDAAEDSRSFDKPKKFRTWQMITLAALFFSFVLAMPAQAKIIPPVQTLSVSDSVVMLKSRSGDLPVRPGDVFAAPFITRQGDSIAEIRIAAIKESSFGEYKAVLEYLDENGNVVGERTSGWHPVNSPLDFMYERLDTVDIGGRQISQWDKFVYVLKEDGVEVGQTPVQVMWIERSTKKGSKEVFLRLGNLRRGFPNWYDVKFEADDNTVLILLDWAQTTDQAESLWFSSSSDDQQALIVGRLKEKGKKRFIFENLENVDGRHIILVESSFPKAATVSEVEALTAALNSRIAPLGIKIVNASVIDDKKNNKQYLTGTVVDTTVDMGELSERQEQLRQWLLAIQFPDNFRKNVLKFRDLYDGWMFDVKDQDLFSQMVSDLIVMHIANGGRRESLVRLNEKGKRGIGFLQTGDLDKKALEKMITAWIVNEMSKVPGSVKQGALENDKSVDNAGGIDLAQSNLDLQIRRDGKGMVLPAAEQDLENIRINGLVPVILKIEPATMAQLFR